MRQVEGLVEVVQLIMLFGLVQEVEVGTLEEVEGHIMVLVEEAVRGLLVQYQHQPIQDMVMLPSHPTSQSRYDDIFMPSLSLHLQMREKRGRQNRICS